jgi:hypothetical protein
MRRDEGGVDVDHHPAGEQLAGHAEPGEPARAQGEQVPHVSADMGTDGGDTAQQSAVQGGQATSDGGVRRWLAEHLLLVGQQCDVGYASASEHDRDRQVDQDMATVPPARSLPDRQDAAQRRGQPDPVGALA